MQEFELGCDVETFKKYLDNHARSVGLGSVLSPKWEDRQHCIIQFTMLANGRVDLHIEITSADSISVNPIYRRGEDDPEVVEYVERVLKDVQEKWSLDLSALERAMISTLRDMRSNSEGTSDDQLAMRLSKAGFVNQSGEVYSREHINRLRSKLRKRSYDV